MTAGQEADDDLNPSEESFNLRACAKEGVSTLESINAAHSPPCVLISLTARIKHERRADYDTWM